MQRLMSSSGSGSGSDKNDLNPRGKDWLTLFLGCVLAIWVVAIFPLVVWGGLHYFLGVPAPSALPFPEPKPILRVSEIKSGVESLNESLNESEIKSESSFKYGKFTVLEWSLKRETVKSPFTGEKVKVAAIQGLIENNQGSNLIIQVNFRIYDKSGNFLESTYAATKPLNYGETWSFKTNIIDRPSEIGSVVFQNITFDYLQ